MSAAAEQRNAFPTRRELRLATSSTEEQPTHYPPYRAEREKRPEEQPRFTLEPLLTSPFSGPAERLDIPLRTPQQPAEPKVSARQTARRGLIRKTVAGTFSLLFAGGLVAGTVVPDASTLLSSDKMGTQAQALRIGGDTTEFETSMTAALAPSPAEELIPVVGSNGQVLAASFLPNSKARYPFDSEVPLTDGFGYRSAPVAGFHEAQDMAPAGGTPVRVIASGIVTEAGWAADGWCGFSLTVQHRINGQSVVSRYCHMQDGSNSYQAGDLIDIGDEAGRVGNTGLSFGDHLHLIIRKDDVAVDPLPFIEANKN